METKKYEVKILEKAGSCDNSLFEKMAKKGDLNSTKVSELIGAEVKIIGYAKCNIETDDKNFNINYFDTEEYGLISSGSEIFSNSVTDYFGEVERVRISQIKTSKGKTYKAIPVLGKKETKKEETEDDLPF